MAQFSIRTFTWADLGTSSVTWADWNEWSGNNTTIGGSTGFGNLVVESGEIDLGSVKNFVVTGTAISNGTHSIVVKIKQATGSFVDTAISSTMSGQFVKFEVTVVNGSETARLDSFEGQIVTDPITETFNQLDLSGLSGTVAGRTLPITKNYNRILSITANAPDGFQIVTTASGSAPAVKGVDLDTFDKVDKDCTADITITGLPAMAASSGNIILNI